MTEPTLRITPSGTNEAASEIHVAPGSFSRLGELAVARLVAHRYAVIADDTVAALYGDAAVARLTEAGGETRLYPFPAGEAHKTRATWGELTDRLLRDGLGRDTAIVALGGGVTGDLAGFVAATYMRGIPWAVVPTTLLAMLDSSVGGKTGVDAPGAKNAIGAFHHPRLVVVDPLLLRTLPAGERRAGLAEAVKTAAIRDASLFERIEAGAARLAAGDADLTGDVVSACLRIKAGVVAEDEREGGVRAILNFGHTAGHALEVLSGFDVRHGEAVGVGLIVEARLGERLGVTEHGSAERLARVVDACGLPRLLESGEAERRFGGLPNGARLLEAARSDKKSREGRVRFVLLRQIGEAARGADGAWTHAASPEDVATALAESFHAEADVRDSAS